MASDPLHNLDDCFDHTVPKDGRRIAWNGLSFCVPSNWELAVYKSLRHGGTRIELEDEYTIRLESEWIRARKNLKLKRIMKRYEAASKPLTLKSDEHVDVSGLPPGWHATHFVFKETGADESGNALQTVSHDLVTAFYLCPQSSVFCFFLLHFMPDDTENPVDVIRLLASTFQDHASAPLVPWQLFDIGFKLPRELVLERTQFDIGVKLMVFTWKLRRYFLWHFSCADVFLKGASSPAEWACGYLNGAHLLKGPVFYPEGHDVAWRRRKPFVLGHREEIATLCYKYATSCRLNEAENKLVVWVYHYRRENDLVLIPGAAGMTSELADASAARTVEPDGCSTSSAE